MDGLPPEISLESSHTPEMVREELRVMSGGNLLASKVTASVLMDLALSRSPLLFGEVMEEGDLFHARRILASPGASCAELREALETAFRPLEIIEPMDPAHTELTHSYDTFSPEWFADIYATVCRVSPLPWGQFVHTLPWCTVCHLVAAAHRAAGGMTARPVDLKAALDRIN